MIKDDDSSSNLDYRKTFGRQQGYTMRNTRARANSAMIRPDHSRFSVMRSVSKGIKNLNITQVVNFDLPPVEPNEPDMLKPETKSIMTLKQIRKLYDDVLTQSNKRDRDLNSLRSQNERLKEKQREMSLVSLDIQKLKSKIETDKTNIYEEYEVSFWNRKCYENLKQRLVDDKLILSKRLLDIEELLDHKKFIRREVESRYEQTKQASHQAEQLLKKMRYNLGELQERKQQKISQYEEGIENQRDFKTSKMKKDMKINSIAEAAMQEKDNSEKNWNKLLTVHRFLKVLLRDKMDREMKKFAIVENAYQSIKTKTGVWQAEQIVEKFINRDQTYGNLLYSIAEAEKKISACKKRNQQLRTLENKLKDVFNELQKPAKKGDTDLMFQTKLLSRNSKKNQVADLMKERLIKYCIQMLRKLDALQGKQSPHYKSMFTKSQVQELYQLLVRRILELECEPIKQNAQNLHEEFRSLDDRRNFRVVVKDEDFMDDQSSVDTREEQAQIEATRSILNSQNAWFFEELRKKQQQILKKKLMEKDKVVVKKDVVKEVAPPQ